MDVPDPLDLFLPPVGQWFRTALGEPTPAQRQGWPAIAAGQHTLILAPTGSGKTLAAFLACLDRLWRRGPLPPGVRVLYVSPLKALNNDIHRNLQQPLEGVAATARELGHELPTITTAVRTGDTPAAERQRLLRRPPHVLITTPESLHLLLTSRARDTLRQLTHCIVDEIHALCPNKRGVFLALLLERLQELNPQGFVRIGLSATQRPLDEVARFLGGLEQRGTPDYQPRPVTIVDAGLRRDLDLQVVSPVEHFGALPEKSIWPSIYRLLDREIDAHRSTIVFANNRRTVERITANLNSSEFKVPSSKSDLERGTLNSEPLCRAHHGSVSLEERQATEQALKEGRLPAVVATASLELGIDMGAVDLVCQVESPGSVARGLQRIGRAGHVVGQKSKGRLIPKMPADLIEQAVLAHEMAAGRVEEVHCPHNCLDVLAQQVVAMTAMEPWDVPQLYAVVRRAYPFHDLTPAVFESVLEMVSGRFGGRNGDRSAVLTALQPRISWDRVHNRLLALPGSRSLALVNGGTIPDTGQYAAITTSGVRIGELDEEFIYERRLGDVFLLGTNAWRLERIDTDRVLVAPAEGAPALVPFWHGEANGRSYDLGLAQGRFLRELADHLDGAACRTRPREGEVPAEPHSHGLNGSAGTSPSLVDWLQRDYFLDNAAARSLVAHVRRQLAVADVLPTDRTLIVEASRDPLGDWQVILLSPFGGRVHLALRLALEHRLRQRLGYRPQCLHHNDGLLLRLTDTDVPILDLFDGLTSTNVEASIIEELTDSALFALRFRQNAARALLLPRGKPGQRTPLWLQRLRGRDLLQVARRHADFPIVAETLRECLHDHLDLTRLQQLLDDIAAHRVEVRTRRAEAPSPFAAGLLFAFTAAFMYEKDRTDTDSRSPALDTQLLQQIVEPGRTGHLLDPRAIQQVERRLRGIGQPPRSATEMAEWLRRVGDLADGDLEGPMAGFLEELVADGRARPIVLSGCRQPERWVLAEEEELYRRAFGLDRLATGPQGTGLGESAVVRSAAETILGRFLATHALVGLRDIVDRYPFTLDWARRQLEQWAQSGRVVTLPSAECDTGSAERDTGNAERWSMAANLEQVERSSLALLRREVLTCPPAQYADFLLRWQHVHPEAHRIGVDGLADVLDRLQGLPAPAELWERVLLPGRIPDYQPRWLDDHIATGDWTFASADRAESAEDRSLTLAFWRREHLVEVPPPSAALELDAAAQCVLDRLQQRGACFVVDLAADTRLAPGIVRAALWQLLRCRLVSNDHFDVIRRGEANGRPAAQGTETSQRGRPFPHSVYRAPRSALRAPRSAEGRWSLLPWGQPGTEAQATFQASLLLNRYGVVARELALLDGTLLPWRVLYEVLSRMELAGSVRRGYFVEGLSGAQFALAEAAQLLQDCGLPSTAAAPAVLLHSLDPANLYGAGAPFDVPLLDGGTRPLLRRAGNWLVLHAGRPVLLVEQQGRRLTALASASRADIAAAVARLPAILAGDRGRTARHKLTVAEWNARPVTATEGRELLEAVGFVRDYQEMTLYAAWR